MTRTGKALTSAYDDLRDKQPQLCAAINAKGVFVPDADGRLSGAPLMQRFADLLAPVVANEQDLRNLDQVLGDAMARKRGDRLPTEVLHRYVLAKKGGGVGEVFSVQAPMLWERLESRGLGLRILCLEDDRLLGALADNLGGLQPLFINQKTLDGEPEDDLFGLLLALCNNERADSGEVLRGLGPLAEAMGRGGPGAACRLLIKLLGQGQRFQSRGTWLDDLLRLVRGVGADLAKSEMSLAGLYPRLPMIEPFLGLLRSEEDASRALAALERVEEVRFGYSDMDMDMRRVLPEVSATVAPLIAGIKEFKEFCDVLPDLVRGLEWKSEETPLGWNHTCDTSVIRDLATRSPDWAIFLRQGAELGLLKGQSRPEAGSGSDVSLFVRILRTLLLPLFLCVDALETLWLRLKDRK